MKTFVQIGTNDGSDKFNQLVKENNPDLIVLVEPNSGWINQIFKNYSYITDKKKLKVENVAINTKSGPCELVIPKKQVIGGNVVYRDPMGDSNLYSLLPMDDWGDDFHTIKADSITFSDLCEKYSISEIDYLQMDTEGFDSQIILSIDFDKVKINKLQYEYWNFECETRYTRYGEEAIANKYGDKGMEAVEEKLLNLGYDLRFNPDYPGSTLYNVVGILK